MTVIAMMMTVINTMTTVKMAVPVLKTPKIARFALFPAGGGQKVTVLAGAGDAKAQPADSNRAIAVLFIPDAGANSVSGNAAEGRRTPRRWPVCR